MHIRIFPASRRLTAAFVAYLIKLGGCLAICGCASPPGARYVYQDGEYGVVGIPSNTFLQRTDYRAQADALMGRHFPQGYEIVRAEEVVEGLRSVDRGNKIEIDAGPAVRGSGQLIALGKLGRSTSYEEKDQIPIRECRIIYRRRPVARPGTSSEFAARASLVPEFYINPNQGAYHHDVRQMVAKAGALSKQTSDSHAIGPLSPSPGEQSPPSCQDASGLARILCARALADQNSLPNTGPSR